MYVGLLVKGLFLIIHLLGAIRLYHLVNNCGRATLSIHLYLVIVGNIKSKDTPFSVPFEYYLLSVKT